MAWYRCIGNNGGGGVETVLNNGQVSTTLSYATANFNEDVSDLSTLLLRFRYENNGTPYEVLYGVNVSDIPVGGSYQFAIYYVPVCEQFLGNITRTSITLTNYRGSWRDVYVDIKGIDSWQ